MIQTVGEPTPVNKLFHDGLEHWYRVSSELRTNGEMFKEVEVEMGEWSVNGKTKEYCACCSWKVVLKGVSGGFVVIGILEEGGYSLSHAITESPKDTTGDGLGCDWSCVEMRLVPLYETNVASFGCGGGRDGFGGRLFGRVE
jgi:hypothetical protein